MALSDKDKFYKICLSKLNNSYSDKIEADNSSLDSLQDDKIIEVQNQIVQGYKEQDRFKVYHITKVSEIDYNEVSNFIDTKKQKFDFLIDHNYSDWSIKGFKVSGTHLEFSFSKFTIKNIKNPNEQERAVKPLVRTPYYFQFMVEFRKENDVDLMILSFPSYRPIPYGTYEFDQEIRHVHSWVNNLNVQLEKADYKGIFDSLSEKKFDKFGFKGEDLKNEHEVIKSVFSLKHKKKDEHSDEMHSAIDKIVGQDMVDTITTGLNDIYQESNVELDTDIEEKFVEYLSSIKFSRKFFDSIQMGCEHGVGYAKYSKENSSETFEYNLEYTKTGEGLIRSKTEKWSTIEPLYDEIVKYFREN